jgi:hypothetical protein
MMPGMRRGDTMALGLALAALLAAACGSEEGEGADPVDAASDAAGPDAGLDGARDTAAAPDRSVQSAPADAPADTSPPSPDSPPDYARSGLPGITAISPRALASPDGGMPPAETALEVAGSDLAADAVVVFGGQKLATTRISAEKLTAQIPAALLAPAGVHAVQVESGPADARARSNILYFTSMPGAATSPEIVGYTPDNGVAGDVIRIVGSNLTTPPVLITGPGGVTATAGPAERVAWSGGGLTPNRDAVRITLPAGWQTGPIVVTTSAGAYRGPIFWVEANLTRVARGTAMASSQFPSTPLFATSAIDNDLLTAWYTATGNCVDAPACPLGPASFTLTFQTLQPIARIAVRGLRDQYRGTWDYLRARFELLDAPDAPPLFAGSFVFPAPERDHDLFLSRPIAARIVRFVAEQDLSTGPGLSEIELFAPGGLAPDGGVADGASAD